MNREKLRHIQDNMVSLTRDVSIRRPAHCEMSTEDLQFLVAMLRELNPGKILEIGVSAGGTTRAVLENISPDAELYSVDLAKDYYRDVGKPVGFVARERYQSMTRRPKWNLFAGVDISECMEEIGGNIDFVILDTVHALPGEFLSFFVFYPKLAPTSFLILHDISYGAFRLINEPPATPIRFSYCNELLFSAIASKFKFLPPAWPFNIAGMGIEKEYTDRFLELVFFSLMAPWIYLPSEKILGDTAAFVEKYYGKKYLDLFNCAITANKSHLSEIRHLRESAPLAARRRVDFDTLDAETKKNGVMLGKKPHSIVVDIAPGKKLRMTGDVFFHATDTFNRVYAYFTFDGKHLPLPGLTKSSFADFYYVYPLPRNGDNHFDLTLTTPNNSKTAEINFVYNGEHSCLLDQGTTIFIEA